MIYQPFALQRWPLIFLALLYSFIIDRNLVRCSAEETALTEVYISGAVLHAPPFATVEYNENGTAVYGGFQADLIERLKIFAEQDGLALTVDLSPAPAQYGDAFDLIANDCNTTENPNTIDDCALYDIMFANFYATPQRSMRSDLSPAWLRSTISTIKYLDKQVLQDVTTMKQATEAQTPVCLKDGTYYAGVVKALFPDVEYLFCNDQDDCLNRLKEEQCALYASDELQLRYRAAHDISLQVTRESFNTQYIVWAFRDNFEHARWVKKWMYDAIANATMDELYHMYFQKELCPVGTAGESCELPCDPDHGEADSRGLCVCTSLKWTGSDCSIEVPENKNLINDSVKRLSYSLVGTNSLVILAFALWLLWNRKASAVKLSQPLFLSLILVGCLISTSTILAMSRESEGYDPVPACAAIPWLYSVGFCITFGTLFAKIRRIYLIFRSAADMRRHNITVKETFAVIGAVLALDVIVLSVWTATDPLKWERVVTRADAYDVPLESEGHCTCDHWETWVGAIASIHLCLLGFACYLCYVSRDIPTRFSEGKYVSIAMFSNLQIFVVGVPMLIILGSDSDSSFFVRTLMVWINDFVVVILIFGNLVYQVHFCEECREHSIVGSAIRTFSVKQKERNSIANRSSSFQFDQTEDGTHGVITCRDPAGSSSFRVSMSHLPPLESSRSKSHAPGDASECSSTQTPSEKQRST